MVVKISVIEKMDVGSEVQVKMWLDVFSNCIWQQRILQISPNLEV